MNAHDRCQLLVATAIDFDVDVVEQRFVERHLATCPTCPRVAAALASDAATIAALPRPIRPVRSGVGSRPGSLRPVPQLSLRLAAIAALLALLALGALAAGGELIRRLEASRLAWNPSPVVPDRLEATESPAVGPSAGPSVSPPPPPCIAAPTVDDLVANGGAWGVACHGSNPIEVVGYLPIGDGANVCEGWEPQWLSCPSGSFIASHAGRDAPLLAYAHDGDVPIGRPPDGPDSVDGQPVNGHFARFTGHFARFTGHFADPRAEDCRATRTDAPLFDDRAGLQRRCRETFVVTALTILVGADVPPPVLDARWTVTAGQTALATPPSTVLQSLVKAGGQWFVLGFDNTEGRSNLWRSPDARTWEPVTPEGFAPSMIATDGNRLFGVGRSGIVEVRTSLDGRTWAPTQGLPANAEVTSVAATSMGVFAGGGIGIDAAVWRLNADRWVQVDLEDAAGFLGGQDAAPAIVLGITELAGVVSAYGEGPPEGGSGYLEGRLWQSKDGATWVRTPLTGTGPAKMLGAITRSDGVDSVIVGSRTDGSGPAAWGTRGGEWIGATFLGLERLPTGSLRDVAEIRGALIAIGYAPTRTDSLDVVIWGSNDGVTWSPLDVDDMNGGFVNDIVATDDGRALAVGWQSGRTGAEPGPAIWELIPTAAP